MSSLTIFKYNQKRHESDFVRLAMYFNKLWQWSMPIKGKPQSVNLMRLYRTLSSARNTPLVKMVANIWFEQSSRGSNLTQKCSTWERREHPKLNNQVLNALRAVADENIEVIDEIWTIAAQKNEVEINIKTVVKFPTSEAAELFRASICELLGEAE